MENRSGNVLTLLLISFLLGMTLYANRKKIKAAFRSRVSKVNHRHRNFVDAVGAHL